MNSIKMHSNVEWRLHNRSVSIVVAIESDLFGDVRLFCEERPCEIINKCILYHI